MRRVCREGTGALALALAMVFLVGGTPCELEAQGGPPGQGGDCALCGVQWTCEEWDEDGYCTDKRHEIYCAQGLEEGREDCNDDGSGTWCENLGGDCGDGFALRSLPADIGGGFEGVDVVQRVTCMDSAPRALVVTSPLELVEVHALDLIEASARGLMDVDVG